MKKTANLILTVVGLVIAQPAQTQGTLYLSNLGVTSEMGYAIGSDSWLAAGFLTGTNSGGYDLNSIQLLMDAASGSPSGFSISIYSFNGSSFSPESSLGSLSGSDPASGGIFTYTTSGLSLSPSTWYFIVLAAATPTAQGYYNWSRALYQSTYSSSGGWVLSDGNDYSANNGSTWQLYRGAALQYAVYATPSPEPSTLAFIILGSGLLIHVCRRKI